MTDGLADEVITVVVAALLTTWFRVDEVEALKFASELYVAVKRCEATVSAARGAGSAATADAALVQIVVAPFLDSDRSGRGTGSWRDRSDGQCEGHGLAEDGRVDRGTVEVVVEALLIT